MKISDIYHMDIYGDNGQYLGDVQDVIVDLEKGELSRLLMVSFKNARGDVKTLLKQKSILYKNVKNVGDVVLVSSVQNPMQDNTTREEVSDLSR
jgi:sporulation protein YlmC with PRC-barrel domain